MNEQENAIDLPILEAFINRFFPRQDIYAEQRRDQRGYVLRHQPVTSELVMAHFRGEITLGTYALSRSSKAHFVAFDADTEAVWQVLIQLSKRMAISSYLERSRRGGHLWFFLAEPVLGQQARVFAHSLLKQVAISDIEIYPKQDEIGDGVGSLIRLPLGFHQRTEPPQRFVFQTVTGEPLAPTVREQIHLLAYAETVPQGFFNYVVAKASRVEQVQVEPKSFNIRPSEADGLLSDKIKEAISVRDFVSRYVELDARGLGKCPFHDDEHPSFAVNDDKNYWSCYAGCGGGSVIDFWKAYRREIQGLSDDFIETMLDLAEMLGL